MIARAGVDHHIAAAERRNRPVGIVAVASGLAIWTVGAEAAIASQIELLWNSSRRRPAFRVAPIIGNVIFLIGDPRARRIEDRRLAHDPRALALEPVIKPLEVRIAWPEIAFIHEVMAVGSNPETLVADAGVEMGKGRQHAGLENIEPGRDMKTGDVDRRAKVMPGAKLVRCGMAEDFVQIGLPCREIRITG